ncbi:MAG TPA: tetratricopeptide repeat protein [Actinomycetota bacterium]|nr:tetratricopeptide repeat protein [Actinomycetota bacterium]
MTQAARIAVAILLAGAMLLAGAAMGVLRGPSPAPGAVATTGNVAFALLGPAEVGSLEATVAQLQDHLRGSPGDPRALALLGLAYLQRGRLTADPGWYPKAERALGRSLALHREGNFEAVLGLGVLALSRHDFIEALDRGREARRLNPYNADARGVIGDAMLELGRYRAAGRAYQEMIDLRPSLSSYARVAAYREVTGDLRGAIRAMAEATALAPTPEDAAWAGFQLGELYASSNRLPPAARAYRTAAAVAPEAVLPRVGLARIAAARGRLDRAARLLGEVVRRYPAPEFVILLGDVHAAAGEPELARRQYDTVRAMERLYRAGGVDTDLEMALFDADHGSPLQALSRARSAYRRRPNVASADALAWALYANDRYREASGYAERALRLRTPRASFRFHAGMIALRLGHIERARRQLRLALAMNPHFSLVHAPTARRILDRLEAGG